MEFDAGISDTPLSIIVTSLDQWDLPIGGKWNTSTEELNCLNLGVVDG